LRLRVNINEKAGKLQTSTAEKNPYPSYSVFVVLFFCFPPLARKFTYLEYGGSLVVFVVGKLKVFDLAFVVDDFCSGSVSWRTGSLIE